MRWPFVWRSTLEAERIERNAERRATTAIIENAQLAARLADARCNLLFDRYHALRLAGAVAPEVVPSVATLPAKPKDEALSLIAEMTRGRPALTRQMVDQLKADRAANKSDDDILAAIRGGVGSQNGYV